MNIAPTEVTENQVEAALVMKGVAPSVFDPAYAEAEDRRILIVDDEEPVRKLFAEYLNESYSCAQAPDTHEALELLSREPFALVLTDIQMPGLGGIELLRKITELYADTAVLFVSRTDRIQPRVPARRVRASVSLVKPRA